MGVSEKRRSTFVRRDGVTVRRCRLCRVEKPLDGENFYALQRTDTKVRYAWECKPCQIKRTGDYARKVRADPVTGPKVRAKAAKQRREWRERNPGANAEAVRRHKQRVKADPVRHAARREADRMTRRLRLEREGKPVGAPHPVQAHVVRYTKGPIYNSRPDERVPHPDGGDCVEIWRTAHMHGAPRFAPPKMPPDKQARLPAAPLAKAIMDRMPERGIDFSLEEFCDVLGITARSLFRWRNEKDALIQFDVVDKVLTNLGLLWFEVWPEEDFPDVAERLAA